MIDDYVKKWLIKANNDLKVAENELQLPSGKVITDAVCFHAQQAVEKFLKAYLITQKVEFGKTHNLEYLRELCLGVDEDFKQIEVGNLTYYAVEVRYPDEFYTPTIKEARESVDLARKIKEFIIRKLALRKKI